MSDLNVPDVNWTILTGSTSFSSQLCNLVFQFNLMQIVDCPTHINSNTLDLIITNCNNAITSLTVQTDHLISDHYLISLTMSFSSTHTNHQPLNYAYDYSKADYHGLQQFLFNCDLTSYYNSNDVNETWLIIKHIILSGINQFIPKVRLRPVQYPV